MSGDPVLLDVAEGIATLTFNRPDVHNAISTALRIRFDAVLDEISARDDIRVVVMRGAGKSFCAGRDMRELGKRDPGETHRDHITFAQNIRRKQVGLGVPVIAALRGHVIGGGAEMAIAADFRIASEDLAFRAAEVVHGLALDTGGSAWLMRLVGPARAKWIMCSGAVIDATTALNWGLVEWVVPPEALDAGALKLARQIAANPPAAVAANRSLVHRQMAEEVEDAMRRELELQIELFDGEEYLALKAARAAARRRG